MTRRKEMCPVCGERGGVPIVWGLVADPDNFAGEVMLGGCVVPAEQYDRACQTCGHLWLRADVLDRG